MIKFHFNKSKLIKNASVGSACKNNQNRIKFYSIISYMCKISHPIIHIFMRKTFIFLCNLYKKKKQ